MITRPKYRSGSEFTAEKRNGRTTAPAPGGDTAAAGVRALDQGGLARVGIFGDLNDTGGISGPFMGAWTCSLPSLRALEPKRGFAPPPALGQDALKQRPMS